MRSLTDEVGAVDGVRLASVFVHPGRREGRKGRFYAFFSV